MVSILPLTNDDTKKFEKYNVQCHSQGESQGGAGVLIFHFCGFGMQIYICVQELFF